MNTFKRIVSALLIASFLALMPSASAQAKGKPILVIENVSIIETPTSAVVSWTTNKQSTGSVIISFEFDDVGYVDQKYGTEHSITVSGLIPGKKYNIRIDSYNKSFGSAPTEHAVIETP